MFKIKKINYDVNKKVAPSEEIVDLVYETEEAATLSAKLLARRICERLNAEGNRYGNFFEVGECEEIFNDDGKDCECYPVSVLWYDHAPDDRENDCQIRHVIGFECVEVSHKLEISICSEANSYSTDITGDTIEECKEMSNKAIADLISFSGIKEGTYDISFEITQNGEYIDRDEAAIKINTDGTYEIDVCDAGFDEESDLICRYFAYSDEDDCASDGFKYLDDAIKYAKKHNLPVVKVHKYFYDESGKIRPDGFPCVVWENDEESEEDKEEKFYDVNFSLSSPACFVISASSKKEAEEEAERMLEEEFTKEEIMAKIRDAVDYGGVKISSIVPLEEEEEEEEIKIRQISADICGLFEELLERHDIFIPDEDREGNEEEACLYGTTYYELEDDVTQILLSLIEKVKKNPKAEINAEEY